MSTDSELDKLKDEIENYLKINNFDEIRLKFDDDMKKFQKYPNDIDEFSKYINKNHIYVERIEKLKQKIDTFKEQNETALQNIEKSKNKIKDLKQDIVKLENNLENKKKMNEKIDDIFDFIGLQIYNKSDSIYIVHLSKLPIKNYDVTFSFEILHDKNNIELKSIKPENCIDINRIMQEMNTHHDDNKKFLKLIVLIRQELIRKYS